MSAVDNPTQVTRLPSSSTPVIASIGAIAAVLAAAAWMISRGFLDSRSDPPFLIVFALIFSLCMGAVSFWVGLLVPVALFRMLRPLTQSSAVMWLYFAVTGAAVGFALPFVVGLLFPMPPRVNAAFGLVGGLACAWGWRYAERNPDQMAPDVSSKEIKISRRAGWIAGGGAVLVVLAVGWVSR